MIGVYWQFNGLGLVYFVEVWDGEILVGGLYGVGIGKVYCGELMFYWESNMLKFVMMVLVEYMKFYDMVFIDCQFFIDYLVFFGVNVLFCENFIEKLENNNYILIEDGRLLEDYFNCWKLRVIIL